MDPSNHNYGGQSYHMGAGNSGNFGNNGNWGNNQYNQMTGMGANTGQYYYGQDQYGQQQMMQSSTGYSMDGGINQMQPMNNQQNYVNYGGGFNQNSMPNMYNQQYYMGDGMNYGMGNSTSTADVNGQFHKQQEYQYQGNAMGGMTMNADGSANPATASNSGYNYGNSSNGYAVNSKPVPTTSTERQGDDIINSGTTGPMATKAVSSSEGGDKAHAVNPLQDFYSSTNPNQNTSSGPKAPQRDTYWNQPVDGTLVRKVKSHLENTYFANSGGNGVVDLNQNPSASFLGNYDDQASFNKSGSVGFNSKQRRKQNQASFSALSGNGEDNGNTSSSTASGNKTAKQNDDLPPSLRDYVFKSYQKCLNSGEQKAMEKMLTEEMGKATRSGTLHSRDWSRYPLPKLPRDVDQKKKEDPYPNFDIPKLPATGKKRVSKFDSEGPKTEETPKELRGLLKGKKRNAKNAMSAGITREELNRREERRHRFKEELSSKGKKGNSYRGKGSKGGVDEEEYGGLAIVGTCTDLEKSYFRLTSVPDPGTIRPEKILKEALSRLMKFWKKREKEYSYMCDQLKAMRQDLTVQGTKNEFCVLVYETHARIALECSDLDQFNQCQTQLGYLYPLKIKGHEMEFITYQVLYFALHHMNCELETYLSDLSEEKAEHQDVQYGIQVYLAMREDNYHRLFALYNKAPHMCSYMMDIFLNKHRIWALIIICRSHVTIGLDYLQELLRFETVAETTKFVIENKGKTDKNSLLCKESLSAFLSSDVHTKKIQLKVG